MKKYSKYIYGGLIAIFLLMGAYFVACKVASDKALEIFNREVSKQQVLKGKITVEDINATMTGNLTFINLKWEDDNGNTIVSIPEGKMRVKPQDIVLGRISTTTIQGLEINNADVAVRFDKNMHVDVVKQRPHKEKSELKEKKPKTPEELMAKRKEQEEKIRQHIRNIDFAGKRIDARIDLNNCSLTAYYKNRVFIINDVDAKLNIDTTKVANIDIRTGAFGGTMVGDDIKINGLIDMKPEIPTYKLHLAMDRIVPSSLGLGVNISDTVSIIAGINGELPTPIIDGQLHFDQLVLPGIFFSKVDGKFHYEDALLNFKDVTADAFGGNVKAKGVYNLNDRHYEIDAVGEGLQSSFATKDLAFNCSVALDFKMQSDGNPKMALSYGTFSSGKGTYHFIPFNGIKGSFSNQNGTLSFTNVEIDTALGIINSEAFSIERGRVRLGPIFLKQEDTGENIRIR